MNSLPHSFGYFTLLYLLKKVRIISHNHVKPSVQIVSQKSGFMVNVILAIPISQCFNTHINILRPPELCSDVLLKIANLSKYVFEQLENHKIYLKSPLHVSCMFCKYMLHHTYSNISTYFIIIYIEIGGVLLNFHPFLFFICQFN